MKYSYERIAGITKPDIKAVYQGDWSTLQQVKVTGKYTGTIILKEKFAPLMHSTLPSGSGLVLSKKALLKLGNKGIAVHPVGTGPYEFAKWTPKQRITVKRFADYAGSNTGFVKGTTFETIEFLPIVEDSAAETGLRAGDIDFSRIAEASVDRFKRISSLKTYEHASLDYYFIALNVQDKVLKDVRLRQAIRLAVDVPSIIAAAYDDRWEQAYGIIPKSMGLGYWAGAPKYKRDVDAAKKLVADAGADGITLRLAVLNAEADKTAAQVIQSNLKDIGINVDIISQDSATLFAIPGDGGDGKKRQLVYADYVSQPDPSWSTVWWTCTQMGDLELGQLVQQAVLLPARPRAQGDGRREAPGDVREMQKLLGQGGRHGLDRLPDLLLRRLDQGQACDPPRRPPRRVRVHGGVVHAAGRGTRRGRPRCAQQAVERLERAGDAVAVAADMRLVRERAAVAELAQAGEDGGPVDLAVAERDALVSGDVLDVHVRETGDEHRRDAGATGSRVTYQSLAGSSIARRPVSAVQRSRSSTVCTKQTSSFSTAKSRGGTARVRSGARARRHRPRCPARRREEREHAHLGGAQALPQPAEAMAQREVQRAVDREPRHVGVVERRAGAARQVGLEERGEQGGDVHAGSPTSSRAHRSGAGERDDVFLPDAADRDLADAVGARELDCLRDAGATSSVISTTRRSGTVIGPMPEVRTASAERADSGRGRHERLERRQQGADERRPHAARRAVRGLDGPAVIYHHGWPGSRKLPGGHGEAAAERGVRLVSFDRAGYGGSSRAAGRTVGDVASDTAAIADALGIGTFGVWGVSGGGPHALACAALLPERVTAAAVVAGIAPYDLPGLDYTAGMGAASQVEFALAAQGRRCTSRTS